MELIKNIDENFNFQNNNIRIIGTYTEPWFVAKDICKILDLSNTTESLKNIPEKWRGSEILSTLSGNQNTNIINEAGLYKLIMRSNKPIAQKFQEAVCEDILPSLRKKGEYKIQSILNKYEQLEEEKKKIEKENKDLHRLVKRKERQKFRKKYSVYIISNPDTENSYKIGSTKNRKGRLENLQPGAPNYYKIEYSRTVSSLYEQSAIESILLVILNKYRVKNEFKGSKIREWVQNLDLETIKTELDIIVDFIEERKIFRKAYEVEELEEKEEAEIVDEEKVEEEEIIDKEKEDIHITKICYVCKEEKYLSEYYDRTENVDGKEGLCKICYNQKKSKLKEIKKTQKKAEEEGKKMCVTCNIILDYDKFYKHGTSKDGYEHSCISCKKNANKIKTSKKCMSCYVQKFIEEFDPYRLGYNKFCKKCVNEKILDIEDVNKKKCYNCKKVLDVSQFPKNKSSYDGYNNSCSICNTEKGKKYREKLIVEEKIEVKNKMCNTCKLVKPIDNFYNRRVSKDGKDLYCKDCKK
uniref:Bro-N domain-containing protein n=1 Tax=viral metagenome TaxID=1070528 RepID=A0A6C0DZV1_9ZZZZ